MVWSCCWKAFGDRTAAEAMKGLLVGAPRDALPTTDEDEFYWADLVGLEVINAAGERLGKVAGLIETGANDVLRVVGDDGTERLLPFVSAVVLAVEKEAGLIRLWSGAATGDPVRLRDHLPGDVRCRDAEWHYPPGAGRAALGMARLESSGFRRECLAAGR
jgi:hypothetical protein